MPTFQKRPRDMTRAEMEALPVAGFGRATQIIEGREVAVPTAPDVGATWFWDDEPQGYTDGDGVRWRFAQRLSDGAWCRVRNMTDG